MLLLLRRRVCESFRARSFAFRPWTPRHEDEGDGNGEAGVGHEDEQGEEDEGEEVEVEDDDDDSVLKHVEAFRYSANVQGMQYFGMAAD